MNYLRVVAVSVFVCALAFGQADMGVLTGTVSDPSGAVVPGAPIEITSVETGRVVSLETNAEGLYVSPPLAPGDYTIEVRAPGFDAAAKRVRVDVTTRIAVDFEINPGTVTEVVNVEAVAPVLQTETSTLSNLREERVVKDLPLNGRNFAQLIQLSAGVMPAQTQQGGSPITMKRGVTGNSVNGTRLEENNFLVDGVSNYENHNGLGILIFPSVEAIEEFRVESSVSDAQFGRGGGATINLRYKTGTREFHGGVFWFLRNEKLDAKNFFDSADGPIPPFKQNQFGANIGGPLLPWKSEHQTFFFFNYEGARVRQSQTIISTVPLPSFKRGDFSQNSRTIFDPLTQGSADDNFARQPFAGNRIPEDRIDQVGTNLVNLFPEPNLNNDEVSNYLFNPLRRIDGDKFDVKIDHTLTERDTFFVRYSHGDDDLTEPSNLPAPAVGRGPGVPGLADQPVNQIVASETHVFSPTKVNEFRAGWTRLNLRAFNPNFGKFVCEEAGVPGCNVPGDDLTSGLGDFNISGYQRLGENGFSPAVIVSDNLQFSDNFNYVKGRHTLKFGGEVLRRRYNAFQSSVLRGFMSFNGAYTQNPASPGGTGFGGADILLGKPINGNIRFLNGTRGFRRTELSFYVQDIFKVTNKLTLTMALRYENYLGWPWTEVNNRQYQFVPDQEDVIQVGTGVVPWRSGIASDNNNLAPRVGLAYRVTGKTVFRAAYGVYYSAPQLDVTRNLGANPPEFIVSAFSNSAFDFEGARPLSQGFDRPPQGSIEGELRAIQFGSRTPYTQQWNAAIQQQLPANISFTVAYVGTKGTKLQGFPNANQPVPGTTAIAQRRPFPRFNTIRMVQTRFGSSYHGLQLTAERRFSQGVSFQAAYTYSHTIDNIGQFGGVTDIRNISLDRGNAGFDVRNRFVVSWLWELPFRASGALNHLVGGWQINGIGSFYDGLKFSPGGPNTLNIGSGTRPDRIGDGNLPTSERSINHWFDASAFTPPGPQMFGNAGRNILEGPGTAQVDLSVFKNFFLSENRVRRLEFRAEFFNFTNTPQFNNPNSNINSAAVGTIRSAGSPLTLQRTPRHIQFGLKFYF